MARKSEEAKERDREASRSRKQTKRLQDRAYSQYRNTELRLLAQERHNLRRQSAGDWENGKYRTKAEHGIVAWDTEGCTDHDNSVPLVQGKHHCNYMDRSGTQSADPQPTCKHRCFVIVNHSGTETDFRKAEPGQRLSTIECLEFLLTADPKKLHVGFSLGYDVCQIIADLPTVYIKRLYKKNRVTWRGYHISWIPRSHLTVAKNVRWETDVNGKHHRKPEQSVTIWDVFKFFQMSFVKALETWNIGAPEERDQIAAMKDERGDFDDADQGRVAEIIRYSQNECRLLVDMVGKLFDAFNSVGIKLSRYDGAGAVASSLFRANGVDEFIAAPPLKYKDRILAAYYGGRIEIKGHGYVEGAYFNDIHSAYPYQQQNVPCLQCLRYIQTDRYTPEAKWAIWEVEWNLSNVRDVLWGPFPFRTTKGGICYPLRGKGFYHACEVSAAMDAFLGSPGAYIEVRNGLIFESTCTHEPFAWIAEKYNQRLDLKAAGNMAEKALKVGLAALYGKTAQSIGNEEAPPPFQSYIWSGMITAGTRAQIYRALSQNPKRVLSIATDCVMSTEPLKLSPTDALGDWEEKYVDKVFLAQAGVYTKFYDGYWHDSEARTRGFTPREVNFDAIREVFARDHFGTYEYVADKLMGLGAANRSSGLSPLFRHWVAQQRVLKFVPNYARIRPKDQYADKTWIPYLPSIEIETPDGYSVPYKPKMEWQETWADTPDGELMWRLEQDSF